MSHAHGTHLDGIATIEDLRQRCFIDEETGCWHLRTARGRAYPQQQRQVIWVFGLGHTTATRAAWMLSHPGKQLPRGWICFRRCESYDCVAPKHISAGTRAAWGAHLAKSGKAETYAKTQANRTSPKSTWKLTPELRQWLIESPQSGSEVAHALGITQGRANAIRAKHSAKRAALPPSSVFDLAGKLPAANAGLFTRLMPEGMAA